MPSGPKNVFNPHFSWVEEDDTIWATFSAPPPRKNSREMEKIVISLITIKNIQETIIIATGEFTKRARFSCLCAEEEIDSVCCETSS